VSKHALVDPTADAILKYNSRLLLYYFVVSTYNAGQIQNNPPLTTDFWGKHLVNCIGYSILKLFSPSFPINHHARAPRYGRCSPKPPEQQQIRGRISDSTRGLEALSMTTLVKFFKDESGATAVEYGLIAAGISVSIIAVVHGLGTKLATTFTTTSTGIK
jgi:pilus assembly protein Flp/PilA